jgi:SHS family lactate transporter-like MFS transporter
MTTLAQLKALTRDQRSTCIASFLGWALDAFDFFLMVFVVKAIAADFNTQVKDVAYAITLTLIFRPLGALVFGSLADRFGRRPILMANILLYSFFELASAFAPSLLGLLILRALFGFAMGGEWGVGTSLVMETIPSQARGIISGILQVGYPFGYLLAAIVYGLFYEFIGWRGMFVVGVLPAFLVLYIRMNVKESPIWEQHGPQRQRSDWFALLRVPKKLFLYVVLLMTAFCFFSHGTHDLYPTFLQSAPHHLSHHTVSLIAVVANIGAIIGGLLGGLYSQRAGRRRAIITAALFALPIIPLWAFSATPLLLGLGAFLLQMAVQGAWGVVPAHLNELSPDSVRSTFPGFAYQLGNLFASSNAVLQANIAATYGGRYSIALATVASITAVAMIVITACGVEAKGIQFGTGK